jgi:hypothetical protein
MVQKFATYYLEEENEKNSENVIFLQLLVYHEESTSFIEPSP